MHKTNDIQLVKSHPLLYKDRYRNIRETCMCWGFDCNDGWYELVKELSDKLELLIEKYVEDYPRGKCYKCGCDYFEHRLMPSGKRICFVVHHVPYTLFKHQYSSIVPQWKRDIEYHGLWRGLKRCFKNDWSYTKYRFKHKANRAWLIWYRLGIKKKAPCKCIEWEHNHPRASQVKEKFGTLSFYMSSATDEMWKLIHKTEGESEVTCEDCGEPGQIREEGWVRTLCDKCEEEHEGDE